MLVNTINDNKIRLFVQHSYEATLISEHLIWKAVVKQHCNILRICHALLKMCTLSLIRL